MKHPGATDVSGLGPGILGFEVRLGIWDQGIGRPCQECRRQKCEVRSSPPFHSASAAQTRPGAELMVEDSRSGVWGSQFTCWGFGVHGLGFWASRFKVQGLRLRVTRFRIWGSGVYSIGFGASGVRV